MSSNQDNIYAGTDSYADKDALAARPNNPDETFNWILQHKNTFNKFKDIQFYKVNPNEDSPINTKIDEWNECENLQYISLQDLDKRFKI